MQKEEFAYSTSDVKDGRRHHKKKHEPRSDLDLRIKNFETCYSETLKIVRAGKDHPSVCEPEQGWVPKSSLVARS